MSAKAKAWAKTLAERDGVAPAVKARQERREIEKRNPSPVIWPGPSEKPAAWWRAAR